MPAADYSSYHQASGTGADGTKFSNFIDAVQATINALDKNNLAAAAGILASQIADPTTGKVLGSSGSACAAVFPPGYEYGYAEKATDTSITATTQATANTVATTASITLSGTDIVMIEVFCPNAAKGTSWIRGVIYEDATAVADAFYDTQTQSAQVGKLRRTPAAGAHTYSFRAYVDAGTGTIASATLAPSHIRVTKV